MSLMTKCCGNVPLHKAALLIASVELFLNSILLFGLINFLVARYLIVEDQTGQLEEILDDETIEERQEAQHRLMQGNIIYISYTILKFATLGAAVCLLMGSQTKNRALLMPYLVVGLINLVYAVVIIIVTTVSLPYQFLVFFVVLYFFFTMYFFYLWICVLSFYVELKLQESQVPQVIYTTHPVGYQNPPSYSTHPRYPQQQYGAIYNTVQNRGYPVTPGEATLLSPPGYSRPPYPIPDARNSTENTYLSYDNIPKSHYGLVYAHQNGDHTPAKTPYSGNENYSNRPPTACQ